MSKKIIHGLLSLLVFCLIFTVSIYAEKACGSNSIDALTSFDESIMATEMIEEHYSDGRTIQYAINPTEMMRSLGDKPLNTGAYIPDSGTLTRMAPIAIDKYGRTQVSPIDKRVGLLECIYDHNKDGKIDERVYATASLQHYDIVISCAHVLWKPEYRNSLCGGWATSINFYAGRNGNSWKYSSSFDHVAISTAYQNNSGFAYDENGNIIYKIDYPNDWSIITLEKNLGGKCGWFGVHGCSAYELNMDVYTLGYPDDKAMYTQWKSSGTILSVDDNGKTMCFSAYNTHGDSGAPIINDGFVYGIATCSFSTVNGDEKEWIKSGGTCMHDSLFSMIMGARNDSQERWGG